MSHLSTLGEFCSRIGCGTRVHAKGLCASHYHRLRREGLPRAPRLPRRMRQKHQRTALGERLTRIRLDRDLFLGQVCEGSGIDHQTYSRMLSDSGAVSLRYYIDLARFYQMPLTALLDLEGPL